MTEESEEKLLQCHWMSVKGDNFYFTNSSEQWPTWEVNRSSTCQEVVQILWNRKVCYCVHNSPQNVLISWQISQAHVPQLMHLSPLLKFSFHLRLLFLSGLFHSVFPTNTFMNFSSPHACYMSCPSRSPWFNILIILCENKSWPYPLYNFLQFPLITFFLGPNIFLSFILSDTLILCFSSNNLDQVSHPRKTTEL
jgi:hypothetical protein